MRRTHPTGLALALLSALVLAPTAVASPLIELRRDGTTVVREDRFLPAADELPAPAPRSDARASARPGRSRRRREADGAWRAARLLAAGEIDEATYDADRAIYVNALALRSKLQGARRVALGAVLRNLENVAASGQLTPTRLPALFATVARNRQWWANGPLLRNGARVGFEGSRLVWQHYAGEGLQIQWLGTFGKANGLWQGGYDASLRALLDEALPLAAQRAGGIAWEYLFRFDGGAPPWVSGLAQGTAVQALARASVRLAEPRYSEAARAALGIFREPPPSGVRIATPAGAHYLIYSFAPDLRVLNAFTQALNGLHDFAALTGDAEGHALFAAGEAQLRGELAQYDTGAWTRYSLAREADLHYHTVARDFLVNLCARLTEDAAAAQAPPPPASPAGGTPVPLPAGGVPAPAPTGGVAPVVPPAEALDPTPYCAAAQRWTQYLSQPPVVKLVSRRARGGKPATLRLTVDKPSYVTLRLRRGGRTVIVLGGRLGSGVRALRWPRPPHAAGDYKVLLHARDLAGNVGTGDAPLHLLRARRAGRS